MMALLDKDEAVAVQRTVEEIANTYPQALVYPFMISSESYRFKDTATGCKNKEFVERWICNQSSSAGCFLFKSGKICLFFLKKLFYLGGMRNMGG